MKLDCGLPRHKRLKLEALERVKKAEQAEKTWVKYFCWLPVRLADHDCRWLEYVERKPRYFYKFESFDYRKRTDVWRIWKWDYRAINE